uniref:Glycine N-acyltransferase-like protein n=1 Tax=Gopherus agassizii TaxID=38772 RepID=A0A452IQY3_9SAUR
MLILSCSSKLRLLEGTLRRGLPDTLLVYGTVMTINPGNPAAQEVLVDSWPEFKVVFTQPCREVKPLSHHTAPGDRMIREDVEWDSRPFLSRGPQDRGPDWLREETGTGIQGPSSSRGHRVEASWLVAGNGISSPSPLGEPRAGTRLVRLSSLDVSHADLLNGTWSFGEKEKNRKYLATLIRHFPSVCLLDSDGHPVSWITSYPFGAMGPGYTLPQHRRRGYMVMLNNLLAKRLHALGYPSYGYMAIENYPMQRLQERQASHGACYPQPHSLALLPALYPLLKGLSYSAEPITCSP